MVHIPDNSNADESHELEMPRPLIGHDMPAVDRGKAVVDLDERDQRDDVKKTTWH